MRMIRLLFYALILQLTPFNSLQSWATAFMSLPHQINQADKTTLDCFVLGDEVFFWIPDEIWSGAEKPSQDVRLVEALGETFVNCLEAKNPNLLLCYKFFLDNTFYITESDNGKVGYLNSLNSLPINPGTDLKSINVLKFNLNLSFDKETRYQMAESNQMIVFHSGANLNSMFTSYRRDLGLTTKSVNK